MEVECRLSESAEAVRRPGWASFARVARYAWASPVTVVGLVAAGVFALGGARVRRVAGVLECTGGPVAHLPGRRFVAITLGHVVLARDAATADACRVHERAHVRQYERFGPLMVPLYLASSAWALLRGRRAYFDNAFERDARAAEQRAFAARHSA
jgi:hypothetical protein